ncbi:MAG: ABC transporter permease subunit [Leptospirales bacterium]|nr:ABC transporter permease subunit [Leptospirales bacterium]
MNIHRQILVGIALLAPAVLAAQTVVGSKKFTESIILSEIAGGVLESSGLTVAYQRELGGTRILWEALLRKDIDLYPEYTGTLLAEILRLPADTEAAELTRLLAERGIAMSAPIGFENTYALGMRRQRATSLGLRRLSDLHAHPDLVFGLSHEFLERQDGWPGLRRRYELEGGDLRGIDHEIGYRGLASGAIDVIDLYTTDAEIAYYDLIALEDDRGYFPSYQAVFLFRRDSDLQLGRALDGLAGKIDERRMIALNARVQLGGESPSKVATDFLREAMQIDRPAYEESLSAAILARSGEHLLLVSVSLLLAVLFGAPLGFVAARRARLGATILAVAGVIQTIPSLALLVALLPLMGIGAAPALTALFLYSLLPIVRGTALGFGGISAGTHEAAESLGLPAWFRFWHVYCPMALPSILSGIKTAAVINVGVATLGALIGAGGYGQTILKGIRLDDTQLILAGALPAAALALLIQVAFDLIERLVVSRGLRQQ